tara:strand:- start:67 stop:1176 length:1110 start_codon:yes stop_codon:yes gene_type:complete
MPSLIYPLKDASKNICLKDINDKYNPSYAPEEFQRPESWGKKDKKDYFQSILMNRLEGSFVLVDIERTLHRIVNIDGADRVYNYFKNFQNQGLEYVILDGNNRFLFILSLLNDQYTIPRGTYDVVIDDYLSQVVIGPNNNVYSKLPKLIKKIIAERLITITIYYQIGYAGLSDIFTNVNNGVPLNAQEKRNALDSEWARWVRHLSKHLCSDILVKIFGPDYKRRLKGDEFLVEAICFSKMTSTESTGVTQSVKNALYLSDFDDIDTELYEEKFVLLKQYIAEVDDNLIYGSSVMNLFWALFNGINSEQQAHDFLELHHKVRLDKDIVNNEGDNYKWACGGLGGKNVEFRMIILPQIVNDNYPTYSHVEV